jgi:hypothetical protein
LEPGGYNTKAANTKAAINTAKATAIMANNTFPMQNNTGSAVSFGHLLGRGGMLIRKSRRG